MRRFPITVSILNLHISINLLFVISMVVEVGYILIAIL